MRRILTWYYMFTKRLLHHYSFIVILALIPVLLPVANNVMSHDSSMFKVALSVQDKSDNMAKAVIDRLCETESVIDYEIYESEAEAEKAVQTQKVDEAWVITDGLEEKIDLYTSGKVIKPIVIIYEFESDIRANLAREKLYGALFPDISYSLYSNFIRNEVLSGKDISDSELQKSYRGKNNYEDIVKVEKLNSGSAKEIKTNYLTAPLRGLFSIIVMLCGLSAAMFFLKDKRDGKYDYISGKRRIIPAFGLCLAATILCSAAVYLALLFSGTYTGFVRETLAIVMFIVCATGFCLFIAMLFDSPNRLGATLPFFIILMIALSPIFFNVKMLKGISLLLPTYYYLHSIYDPIYILYMLGYSVAVYVLAIILNGIKAKKGL